MTQDNSRLAYLELNLNGNWSNEKMTYSFLGTEGVGQYANRKSRL